MSGSGRAIHEGVEDGGVYKEREDVGASEEILVDGEQWGFVSRKEEAPSSVELREEAGFEQRYYECDMVGLDGVLVSPITSSFRTQRGGRVRGFRPLKSYL